MWEHQLLQITCMHLYAPTVCMHLSVRCRLCVDECPYVELRGQVWIGLRLWHFSAYVWTAQSDTGMVQGRVW